ncbi:INO80 complex subunit D like [Melia azedarach]|uniref:INO80 complex subunit D like n=1 Tax=Melia azedarach TaxID=155640 RepID=A0ACC1YDG1_MELAZ|nr:INO80 complex subunit D like [Melia azedarach]
MTHNSEPPAEPMAVDATDEESAPSTAEFLTRYEVLKRRSQRAKRLSKLYRSHYWALMEELRAKYKEYYWVYGKSPYREDNSRVNGNLSGFNNNNSNGNNDNEEKKDFEDGGSGTKRRDGNGEDVGYVKKCGVAGCKAKAMALTRFCHPHILSDSKQKLYKGCSYVIKSGQTGPILCGKPVLRSTVPSLCPIHFQKAEKHVARALKKAGLNVTSPSKVAPKLHIVVAEYVRQIQTKRRAAQKAAIAKVEIKEEKTT